MAEPEFSLIEAVPAKAGGKSRKLKGFYDSGTVNWSISPHDVGDNPTCAKRYCQIKCAFFISYQEHNGRSRARNYSTQSTIFLTDIKN